MALIASIESLIVLFPEWLLILALLIQLATLGQAAYWTRRGMVVLRPLALLPLIAATGALVGFYLVITLEIGATIELLRTVSRVLIFVMSAATTHLLAGYWQLSWEAWRDRR